MNTCKREPGMISTRACTALDAGWVCVFDRTKGGPREFEAAAKKGHAAFARSATGRYIVLYRPDPDEVRTWATPGKWVGTNKLGEANKWQVAICAGDDERGVLPVADGAQLGGLNHRQFLFCQYRLQGKSQAEAYRLAGYKSKAADSDASKLEANPRISQYLEQARSKTVRKFTMTREDLLAWHQWVMETPPGEIDPNHPLCQEYEIKDNGKMRIKGVGKSSSAVEIKNIMGWDEAVKAQDKGADAIAAMAQVLREQLAKKK